MILRSSIYSRCHLRSYCKKLLQHGKSKLLFCLWKYVRSVGHRRESFLSTQSQKQCLWLPSLKLSSWPHPKHAVIGSEEQSSIETAVNWLLLCLTSCPLTLDDFVNNYLNGLDGKRVNKQMFQWSSSAFSENRNAHACMFVAHVTNHALPSHWALSNVIALEQPHTLLSAVDSASVLMLLSRVKRKTTWAKPKHSRDGVLCF